MMKRMLAEAVALENTVHKWAQGDGSQALAVPNRSSRTTGTLVQQQPLQGAVRASLPLSKELGAEKGLPDLPRMWRVSLKVQTRC